MDPLSDVLSLLKLRNTMVRGFDLAGPWSIQFPAHQGVKCYAVVSGQGWLSVEGVADPVRLEAGDCLLLPRGRERAAGSPPVPMYADPTALRVTVTPPSGEAVTGGLVRLTDFEVTLYDAAGRMRSWLRSGETPKVTVTDPLQAHVDHLTKWTDAEMHNMTAYLAGLKQ